MKAKDKVLQLRKMIADKLISQIDHDYVLLDLPYHSNLGDTLIWQGELDFLRQLPYKKLYSTWFQGNLSRAGEFLRPGTILLFHGGGNFGDVWPVHGQFRRKAIAMFPNQKCIILPQTIYYQDKKNLLEEAAFYAKYPNVTICARDNKSFEILKEYFPNNPSLLVPDMAFCMDMKRYKRTHNPLGAVFIRRTDKEINNEIDYQHIPEDADVSDWLFLGNSKEYERQKFIVKWASRFDSRLGTDWKHKWLDLYWHHVLRPLNVKTAIRFLDRYEQIYTTRMHAAILSVILGKEDITLFDNSYGKSSSFLETWLSDVDGLQLIK